MPDSQNKLEKLFLAALEIPAEDRRAFIDNNCNGETQLKEKLHALLSSDEQADSGDFLEKTAVELEAENLSEAARDSRIGRLIGNYKILEKISAGGMGAVYLAERADGQFEKKVALKLIKRGMDSEAILQRFLLERRILANLEHPNIARLLDAGMTENGLPFFAMEYVEGEPITDFCQKRELSIRERLELFRSVCSAVAYAHQNLIVHRDLKPSNLLVTKDGVPKLLDFGIAKLLDANAAADVTKTDFRILTPAYASPEQVRGEFVTTASDIYSLGIIFYELLTENSPYQVSGKSMAEIIRVVCETNPKKPSSVITKENPKSKIQNLKSLDGDLDNIALKALQKEPARRYSSAEKFADDVCRYLEGLPIAARPDTFYYRAEKFISRHKIGAAAVFLIFLTLVGGIAATTWQASVAQRERKRAVQRFNDVRSLVNSFLFELNGEMEKLPGATKSRQLLVRRTLEYLDNVSSQTGDDSTLQRELASAYEKVGDIQGNSYYDNLGDTEGSLRSYQKSLVLREQLSAADSSNTEIRRELAQSLERVGDMLWTKNDLEGGLEKYRRALEIEENLLSIEPENLKWKTDFAVTLMKTGDLLGNPGFANLGKTSEAISHHKRALLILESLPESDKQAKRALADTYHSNAMVLRKTGKRVEALELFKKVVKMREEAAQADASNIVARREMASAYVKVGDVLFDDAAYAEAKEFMTKALTIAEPIAAFDPSNAEAQRTLSIYYGRMGRLLKSMDDLGDAAVFYQKALELKLKLFNQDPTSGQMRREVAVGFNNLGDIQDKMNQPQDAMKNYLQALAYLTPLVTESANSQIENDLGKVYGDLAGVQLKLGNTAEALENNRRAVALREKIVSHDGGNTEAKRNMALSYAALAQTFQKLSSRNDACKNFQLSSDIWLDLSQQGVKLTRDQNKIDEINRELKLCDKI